MIFFFDNVSPVWVTARVSVFMGIMGSVYDETGSMYYHLSSKGTLLSSNCIAMMTHPNFNKIANIETEAKPVKSELKELNGPINWSFLNKMAVIIR